ncbi:SMCs flexible hinge [Butyriboletus roseoflavus]|nr:SMCs flexible hinge [Butyriboletus roseoflavus]
MRNLQLKKTLQEDEQAKAAAGRTIQENTTKIDRKHAEIEDHEVNLKKEEDVLESIRDSLKGALCMLVVYLDELNDLKAKKVTLQKDLQAHTKNFHDAQARIQELRGKAPSLRQRTEEAKAFQAASTSQNKVLDHLTHLKQTGAGRIDGFHAVSEPSPTNVTLPSPLPAMHCTTWSSTPSPNDKPALTSSARKTSATPENVPRLYDLIKPKDSKFLPAFYKAVGNTLVANDLEQANRIAFGSSTRWRVVTLAGQLIDSSGTMSSGGNHFARGGTRMSSKVAADALGPKVLRQYKQGSEEAVRKLEEATRTLR